MKIMKKRRWYVSLTIAFVDIRISLSHWGTKLPFVFFPLSRGKLIQPYLFKRSVHKVFSNVNIRIGTGSRVHHKCDISGT